MSIAISFNWNQGQSTDSLLAQVFPSSLVNGHRFLDFVKTLCFILFSLVGTSADRFLGTRDSNPS